MNHFVHCCPFSTSNKITSKGCQSASKTCDFDAKNAKFFSPDPSPSGEGDTPSPHPTPLGAFGASILTPPNFEILPTLLTVCIKFWAKIRRGSRGSRKLNTRGLKNCRFSTNVLLNFENGTRYGRNYNGRRIRTRVRSIDWCHFQWSWVAPNPDFKVTIFWTSNNSKMVHDLAIVTIAD